MHRTWIVVALAGLLAGISSDRTWADYLLQRSDVLTLSVSGATALEQRAVVDIDGDAVFPLVGRIAAAGHTVASVEQDVRKAVASKPVDQSTGVGIRSYFVDPSQVTVTVTDYSPVYVRGDVTKPGSLGFRPGMTVRQAIAVAGGYDLLRFRVDNPFVQSAQLRGDYDEQSAELANGLAHIGRLEAELAGNASPDFTSATKVPVPRDMLAQIIQAEREQLDLRLSDLANQKDHLRQETANAQSRFDLLTDAQAKAQQARDADAADLANVGGLLGKGLSTATRVADARRNLLSSSILFLNTAAQLGAAGVTLENDKRTLDSIDPERRLEILKELEQSRADLAKTQAKLSATSEQLLYMGSQRTDPNGGIEGVPKIMVYANGAAENDGRAASESDILSPGDLVDVTLIPADQTVQTARGQ